MPNFVERWNDASARETARKLAISSSARQIEQVKRQRELAEYAKAGSQLNLMLEQEANPAHMASMTPEARKDWADRRGTLGDRVGVAGMGRIATEAIDEDILARENAYREYLKTTEMTDEEFEVETRRRYSDLNRAYPYDVGRVQVNQSDVAQVRGAEKPAAAPSPPTQVGVKLPVEPEAEVPPTAAAPPEVVEPPSEDTGGGYSMFKASMQLHRSKPEPISPEQARLAFTQVTRPGLEALRRQPGVDPAEVERSLTSAAEEAVRGRLYPDVQTARAAIEAETAPVEDAYTAWVRQLGPEGLTPQGTPKQPDEFTDPFNHRVAVYIQRFGLAEYDEATGKWDFSAAVDEAQYDVKEEQRTADAAEKMKTAQGHLNARWAQLKISQQTADRLDATAQRAINAITSGDPKEARTALRAYSKEYRTVDRQGGWEPADKEKALKQIEELMIPLEDFLSGMAEEGEEMDADIDAILEGVGLQ